MGFIKDLGSKVAKVGDVLKKSYGPLAKLEPDNYYSKAGIYRYPLEVGTHEGTYPHTVEFHFYEPQSIEKPSATNPKATNGAAGINVMGADLASMRSVDAGSIGNTPVKLPHPALPKEAYSNLQGAAPEMRWNRNVAKRGTINDIRKEGPDGKPAGAFKNVDWKRKADLKNIIAMYIPRQATQDNFNIQYTDAGLTKALGGVGFLAAAAAKMRNDEEGYTKYAPLAIEALSKAVLGPLKAVGDEAILREAGTQVGLGYAENPQLEILYNTPQFREFTFEFKMLPRTQKEADEIRRIVHTFKYHASPEFLQGGAGRFAIPPSYVDVYFKYRNEENERLPMKISTCVISAIDLDMGSTTNQFVTFSDGSPLEIVMTLRLRELEIMHKALRLEGY